MRFSASRFMVAVLMVLVSAGALAVNTKFHDAPDSAKAMKNPYEGKSDAADAGKVAYARNCLACHGKAGKGTGNIPSLVDGKLDGVAPGEVFWFITQGSPANGMPSWAALPEASRWQIVTYVNLLAAGKAAPAASATPAEVSTSKLNSPPPTAPFTDFRYEAPGTTRKITVKDLPAPFATKSADNGAELVAR